MVTNLREDIGGSVQNAHRKSREDTAWNEVINENYQEILKHKITHTFFSNYEGTYARTNARARKLF